MKKILSIVLAVVMVAGCCVALSSCSYKDTINIGVSGPLTGDAAVYGQAVANAAQLAVDEINAQGGLNGIEFRLIATDDQADAAKVETNYNKMMRKGMQVSLGCVTTGACLEFKNLSKADDLFFLTPSASGDSVPEFSNGYQMCFADSNQGGVAALYVQSLLAAGLLTNGLKIEEVGVFYKSDDAYSKGIYDKFIEMMPGIPEANRVAFTGTNSDFTAQIDALKGCKFIFMPIYYTPASQFMVQAKDKIDAKAIYYGCDGFDGIESAEGFDITSIPQEVSMLSHYNSKATEGKAKEFADKYEAKYGKDTLNQFGASAYDCVWAIYGAMKKAVAEGKTVNNETTVADMCAILKEQFNGEYTYSGATGTNIKWADTGYVAKVADYIQIKAAN
ncbi:MAG: ABC transporter substrate-binding protein [Clostridia bacterium]|nr:ABC transporter substrate-binding protein [Clostridia bacterium]MBQ8717494.1 ABC transporter substrate-binding protein [Clostridia bacterium]